MLTQKLAEFVINTSSSDLPREALDGARDALVDTIGCGLAGASEEACRIVVRFLRAQGGNGQATVIICTAGRSLADVGPLVRATAPRMNP